MSSIIWTDVDLGVASWDSNVGGYVLRVPRRDDLPLSFNTHTRVGHIEGTDPGIGVMVAVDEL